jgi:hypothetical protein
VSSRINVAHTVSVFLVAWLLALPARAQMGPVQQVPAGPCVLAGSSVNFCIAPAQNGYWMTGNLTFQGKQDMLQVPAVYAGSIEIGDIRDSAGIAASERGILLRGTTTVLIGLVGRAKIPLSQEASITTEGEETTDSAGVAVVPLDVDFLRMANTDPALNGGYRVKLTATGPEGVYWDRRVSTPTQFVVRSFSGRRAEFVYEVTAAVSAKAEEAHQSLRAAPDRDVDNELRVESTTELIRRNLFP